MPPILALFLGFVVVAWLLRRDVAFRGRMSLTLWVPFLWLLIRGSRPVTAWIGYGGASEVEGNPVEALVAFCLFFAAFVVLLRRRFPWSRLPALNVALTLLFVYFAVSCLWSPNTFVAFKRWSKEMGAIFVILVILTEARPMEALKGLCVRCAYVLFPLSEVLIKYYPEFGREYSVEGGLMVNGVTDQKNTLGLICCVFGLALIWDIVDARKLSGGAGSRRRLLPQWIALALGMWLLVQCESKTSLLAFLAGLAIFLGTSVPMIRRVPTFFARCWVVIVPVVLIVAAVNTVVFAPVLETLGRNTTFTERTKIWTLVLDQKTDPLVGTGFYSFWLANGPDVWSKLGGVPITSSHNGYLETYLDGGFIGCALLGLFLLGTGWRLARAYSPDHSSTRVMLAYAIMALITNFAEVYFFRLDTLWFCLEFSAFALALVPLTALAPETPVIPEEATV